ncbi:hypothetical protein JG688_00013614 [Phytophthora aleatoria]|uniref:Uncharacterized protein n=1 Tax=Phytophthora aleatoria TaxID=2496075 RepID=A0A8J5IZ45_9STRA|nr:hypothetical protein JG688_00013614 [Phytophthora aleatoria]
MADAGSRVWQSTQHRLTFTNLTYGWSQGEASDKLKESLASLGALLRDGALADSSPRNYKRYCQSGSTGCRVRVGCQTPT